MSRPFRHICFFALAFLLIVTSISCKSHKPYNPFLTMKTKPGAQQRKDDKKVINKGNKRYKKQLESNRKHLFGKKHAS